MTDTPDLRELQTKVYYIEKELAEFKAQQMRDVEEGKQTVIKWSEWRETVEKRLAKYAGGIAVLIVVMNILPLPWK